MLTAVCDCPKCGAAVCAVMYVKDGALEPVENAFSGTFSTPNSRIEPPSRAERGEKGGKVVRMPRFDSDMRSQPEA